VYLLAARGNKNNDFQNVLILQRANYKISISCSAPPLYVTVTFEICLLIRWFAFAD